MKNQKDSIWLIAIAYIFCFMASSQALVRAITQEEIFLDKSDLNLHIHKESSSKIVVGPIYGKYFISNDSGEQFNLLASFSLGDYEIFERSEFKELYAFSFATDSLTLKFRKNKEEGFKNSSLSEFVTLLGWANSLGRWRFGKIDFLKPPEVHPVLFGFIMVLLPFFASYLINKKFEEQERHYYIWQTLFYFGFIFFLTLFAIPQFREIYDSMGTYRFPASSLCFINSWGSFYGLILNSLVFGVLSPTIFFQLRHLVKKDKIQYLKVFWAISILFIGFVGVNCIFFPML